MGNLLKNNKEIMKYWDYEKNDNDLLNKITTGSQKLVWWKCEKQHSYQQIVKSKTKGVGCPICSNKLIVKGINDLATTNPELLQEWDYSLNNVKPNQISKGSEKKVWWKCNKCGESYESFLYSKEKNKGCPFCSNKKIKQGLNDIFTLEPNWKKYWNFELNKISGIDPYKLSTNSHTKVNWICSKCNKKFVRALSKTKDTILCNKCSTDNAINKRINTLIIQNGNLKEKYPFLVQEWDYNKNKILPENVTPSSSQKVWWICENGHSYKNSVSHRVNGRGCPKCSKEKSISFPEKAIVYYLNKVDNQIIESYQPTFLNGKEIDIYIKNKNIGIEYDGANWHTDIDRDIEKNKLCYENNLTLYRIREKNCPLLNSSSKDIYVETNDNYKSLDKTICELIKNIYNKEVYVNINNDRMEILKLVSFTIKQKSLEVLYPEIAKEWNYAKNKGLLPSQFYATSSRKVWWICKNNHEYECTISHRTIDNNSCPYCSNQKILKGYNDLATTNPDLLQEWNYNKNNKLGIYPDCVFSGSHKKVWWICNNKHEWEASISNKSKGRGCPICSNKIIIKGINDLSSTHKKILNMWDYNKNNRQGLFPENYSYGSSKKVFWLCPKCGNSWIQRINHITNGIGCPNCHFNILKDD